MHQVAFPGGTVVWLVVQGHGHGGVLASCVVADVVLAGIAAEVITGAVCDRATTVGAPTKVIVAIPAAEHVAAVTARKGVSSAPSEELVIVGAASKPVGCR